MNKQEKDPIGRTKTLIKEKENELSPTLKIGDRVKLGYVPFSVKNLKTGMEVTVNSPSHLRGNQETIELKREDNSTFLWPVDNLEKVNQQEATKNNTGEDKMLNDSAKPEIKATGDNLQEIKGKTVLLAMQLIVLTA